MFDDRQRPDPDRTVGSALRRRRYSRHASLAVRLSAVRATGPARILLRAISVTTRWPVRSVAGVPVPGQLALDAEATAADAAEKL